MVDVGRSRLRVVFQHLAVHHLYRTSEGVMATVLMNSTQVSFLPGAWTS